MKVVYTTEALADLDGIFDYIANHSLLFPERSKIGFTGSLRVSPDGRRARRKSLTDQASVSHRSSDIHTRSSTKYRAIE